jgi:hypothetical protein
MEDAAGLASCAVIATWFGWEVKGRNDQPLPYPLVFNVLPRYDNEEARCCVMLAARIGKAMVQPYGYQPCAEAELHIGLGAAEDKIEIEIILRLLQQNYNSSSPKEIIARFRSYERATATLLRRSAIQNSVEAIVDAQIEQDFSWSYGVLGHCDPQIPFGAEKKFLASAGGDWLQGFYWYPIRLKKDDVLLTRDGDKEHLRVLRDGADMPDASDFRSYGRGEVTEWLREQGITPLRLNPKGWQRSVIRIEDITKRVYFKMRFDL